MIMNQKITVIGLCGQSIMLKVNQFPKPGETIQIQELFMEPGGKGFNQAIALAKLGCEVAFCSSVGEDETANTCKQTLCHHKIGPLLIYKKNEKSAYATVVTNAMGENQVSVYPGASNSLDPNDIINLEPIIASSSIVLTQLEQPLATTRMILEISNKHHIRTILNPAPAIDYDMDLLRRAWLITPNELEAKTILNLKTLDDDHQLLVRIQKCGFRQIVITVGEKGAIVAQNGQIHRLPAMKVQVVDTVGAGDAFNAGLAAQIVKGASLIDAVKFGIIVLGLSITKAHVIDSFPTIEEVQCFYEVLKSPKKD